MATVLRQFAQRTIGVVTYRASQVTRHPPLLTTNRYLSSSTTSTSAAVASVNDAYRPRRALLYMPGSSPKMLQKAQTLAVDTVCMDLEDAVAANQKVEARRNIVQALNQPWTNSKAERLGQSNKTRVRINPIGSGFEEADIETILTAKILPDGLVIPKVECASHLQYVDAALVRILGAERAKDIILIALIESVQGMINIREIARSSKRLRAFIFGADDYRASVGAIKTSSNHEVAWARNLVLLHAKAVGIDAIDLVQTNFKDESVIEKESREGFEMGYTGKQIIHPNQIGIVQRTFSPDAKTIEWARKVVAEAKKQEALGVGAFVVDGQMVDMPLIKKAHQIVAKADLSQ